MKSSDLHIAELIQFSPGFVGLHGRRLLIHDLSSLGQFRRDLIEMVGLDMARRILTRKGLFWGQADCAAMQRVFTWDNTEELLRAMAELAKIMGMCYPTISNIFLPRSSSGLKIEITCADSTEVEQHRNELGKAKYPVCWVLAGYFSGFTSYCMGKDVYFSEISCQGTEASSCVFIGKDLVSWGSDLDKELSYFFATDFNKKVQKLSLRIREQQRLLALHRKQSKVAQSKGNLSGIEFRSKAFGNVIDFANRVASFDTTVLITGETGTGKEILARYIHSASDRKESPFLAINCSALPESLLENELFGHKAGAFTGAHHDEVGLFEAAQHGTIFLDEIGDVSPAIQAKLLRVLQTKEIRPVGSTRSQKLDVRVISATNRDLDALVSEGTFRQDLLYRLRVLHVNIPPLRVRTDDILPLARLFLDRLRRKLKLGELRLAAETVDILICYAWPGNVRELENALEHAAVLCSDGIILPDVLPGMITGRVPTRTAIGEPQPLANIVLEHIAAALEKTNGNRAEAAKILKISESTLYRRLRLKATSLPK